MANAKKSDVKKEPKVDLYLPFVPGVLEDDVFVSVNTKNYLIKRGVTVKVPLFVKEVVDNSDKATADALEFIRKELEKAQNNK